MNKYTFPGHRASQYICKGEEAKKSVAIAMIPEVSVLPLICLVLCANGIKTYLFSELHSRFSHLRQGLDAAAGIVTASHNRLSTTGTRFMEVTGTGSSF